VGLVFVCVYLRQYLVGRQWVGRPICVCAQRWHLSIKDREAAVAQAAAQRVTAEVVGYGGRGGEKEKIRNQTF
jgi:hypothetical protein